MTGPSKASMLEITRCGAHNELVKRLDDRWEDFTTDQKKINNSLFLSINSISKKLNWILAGIALIGFMIPLLFQALSHLK